MKNEIINEIDEITRSYKRKVLNLISDKYKEHSAEITTNFNMGLITFYEKTEQLNILTNLTLKELIKYDIPKDLF